MKLMQRMLALMAGAPILCATACTLLASLSGLYDGGSVMGATINAGVFFSIYIVAKAWADLIAAVNEGANW